MRPFSILSSSVLLQKRKKLVKGLKKEDSAWKRTIYCLCSGGLQPLDKIPYKLKEINCTGNTCAIAHLCITSAFLAYVHSSAITLPPRIIQIILNMLFKPCRMPSSHLRDFTRRLVLMLGIFGLNMFIFALSIAIPAQVLLLSSNFYLKGTAIFICIFTLGAINNFNISDIHHRSSLQ